ncbi:hypothetical protein QTG56_24230 (plasmid) [Rossellomorea sp. AcN35-11]|nr:hypothetical protein [Rossellomorea aquimaris]WJV31748.1 hypothetical protein QTG56_24230 [Rossellomorea sp. AcN35-11]
MKKLLVEELRKIVEHNHKRMAAADHDQNLATNLYTMEHNGIDVYDFFVDETMRESVEPFSYYPFHKLRKFILTSWQELNSIRFSILDDQKENLPTGKSYADFIEIHPQRLREWKDILSEDGVGFIERSGHVLDQFTAYFSTGAYMDLTLHDGTDSTYCTLSLYDSIGDLVDEKGIEVEELEGKTFELEDEEGIIYRLILLADVPQITLLTAYKAMIYVAYGEGIELNDRYCYLNNRISDEHDLDVTDMIDNLENLYASITVKNSDLIE